MNTAHPDRELQAIFTCIHEIVAAPHLPAALKLGMCRQSLDGGDPAAAAAAVCGILSAAADPDSAQALLETCGAKPLELRAALALEDDAAGQRWAVLMQALLEGLGLRSAPACTWTG